MPTTTIASNDHVIAWFNDDVATDAGNYFRVQKQVATTEIFRVEEDGDVVLFGDVLRGSCHYLENAKSGSGSIVAFKKDTTERLVLGYTATSNTTYFSSSGTLSVRSARDIYFDLDHDGDASASFYVKDGSGNTIVSLGEDGAFAMNSAGTARLALAAGSLTLGDGTDARGHLWIQYDSTGGSERAGVLVLEDKTGVPWYFFIDSSNRLRVNSADPGTNDASGNVVGSW